MLGPERTCDAAGALDVGENRVALRVQRDGAPLMGLEQALLATRVSARRASSRKCSIIPTVGYCL